MMELALAALGMFPPLARAAACDQAAPSHLTRHDLCGWRLSPNHTFTNDTDGNTIVYVADGDGFRKADRPEEPRAQAKRIAFIGDSFTFGTGVAYADTFASRAAAALGAVALNRGLLAYGVDQMWLTLRNTVLAEKPDLIVVSVIDDDFERSLQSSSVRLRETLTKPRFMLKDGKLTLRTPSDEPGAICGFLERESRLMAAWNGLWRRMGRQWAVGEWWDLNAALIDTMIDDARAAGIPILIAYIRTCPALNPLDVLERHVTARGVPYVDIGREWNCSPQDGYYPHDRHYNAKGHAAAADVLVRVITERWPHIVTEH